MTSPTSPAQRRLTGALGSLKALQDRGRVVVQSEDLERRARRHHSVVRRPARLRRRSTPRDWTSNARRRRRRHHARRRVHDARGQPVLDGAPRIADDAPGLPVRTPFVLWVWCYLNYIAEQSERLTTGIVDKGAVV